MIISLAIYYRLLNFCCQVAWNICRTIKVQMRVSCHLEPSIRHLLRYSGTIQIKQPVKRLPEKTWPGSTRSFYRAAKCRRPCTVLRFRRSGIRHRSRRNPCLSPARTHGWRSASNPWRSVSDQHTCSPGRQSRPRPFFRRRTVHSFLPTGIDHP